MQEVNADQVLKNEKPVEIEVSLQEFDDLVQFKKDLDELETIPAFQRVIYEHYIDADGARLNGFLMSRNIQAIRDRDQIVEKIVSKGVLEHWLRDQRGKLEGIDNPEQRIQLVKELEALKEEQEAHQEEGE